MRGSELILFMATRLSETTHDRSKYLLTPDAPSLHTFPCPASPLQEIQKRGISVTMKRIIGNFAFWVCVKLMSLAALHLVLDAFHVSPLKLKII